MLFIPSSRSTHRRRRDRVRVHVGSNLHLRGRSALHQRTSCLLQRSSNDFGNDVVTVIVDLECLVVTVFIFLVEFDGVLASLPTDDISFFFVLGTLLLAFSVCKV